MKIRRKIKQSSKKVARKLSGVKLKVVKKGSGVAPKARRVARSPAKRSLQGAKLLKRTPPGSKRTNRSKAREAGKAVGTFLGKAIGNAERLINTTAETAKGILS